MIRLVRIVRNVEFTQLFDIFFITSISTILLIRFYLKITGYPVIGGSTLHFAHLLPGTLLMLAAVLMLLAAVNRGARGFAAFIAGLGFGLVWDELGKFITKDNDYFFHATPGLIYITFIILYLIVRYSGQRRYSQDDYMANVLDLLKDAAIKDLDQREYDHAKQLLAHVSPQHILYEPTRTMLESVKPNPLREPSVLDKSISFLKRPLLALSHQAFFPKLVIYVAAAYGYVSLFAAVFFFVGVQLNNNHTISGFLQGDESDLAGGISALASAVLVVVAIHFYRQRKAKRAYRLFEQGLLVNIFIGQVVLFFKSQGVALIWLAVTLFLLINLEILSRERAERSVRHKTLPPA